MIDDPRSPRTAGSRPPAGDPRSAIWRSLSELSDPKHFRELTRDEFLPGASELNRFNRRNFLKLMGASLALAGLPACTRQPLEKIVPYVRQPEELVPGRPLYFATAMTLGGFATGLIAESHEGHPTKLEGNPGHPASLGATNVFHQAALLDLYDPDRSKAVLKDGRPDTWENFVAALNGIVRPTGKGRGLRLLTETVTSPTLYSQVQKLRERFPGLTWHRFEPIGRDNVREGAKLAFGEIVETRFHFDKTSVVVSLDSDFLYSHPDSVRYARDFSARRRARPAQTEMNRLYIVESAPTITGANADHRLPVRHADIEPFARALAIGIGAISDPALRLPPPVFEKWITTLKDDLLSCRGRSIIIAGDNQPPVVHAIAHHLNHFLGNVGNTVEFIAPAEPEPVDQLASLRQLADALQNGDVETLVILGGNPAFTAPAEMRFADSLKHAKFTAHLSPDVNETSARCDWHVPQNHFLESWSDARAFDGTVSVIQPLILPLYQGRSAHELLDALFAAPGRTDYDIVRDHWNSQNPGADFESRWRQALHDGFIADTASPPKKVGLRSSGIPASHGDPAGLEITFRPDPTLLDGRFANNGWLQELPKPIVQLVWDNAAYVSPALARQKDLANGDVIELSLDQRHIRVPVWITPGQPDDSVALHFGYGRQHVGQVGRNTGTDVYPFRTSATFWTAHGVALKKTGGNHHLVTRQAQQVIDSDERQILREGTFEQFQRRPDFVRRDSESPVETLFNPPGSPGDGYRWGMAIDLTACIGCAACTLACQAENNIPTVGKDQVAAGRIMHWIRVDAYFRGTPENPAVTHQPVPCMHCEQAPCEVVCPVAATMHDQEGLNVQVYNRCVGTRYCSNNCPYKVRRFNFFDYADYTTPGFKPMRNPNVTVRWRGVMEKCTYCIQRISAARITAEEQDRRIRDGELRTACQQVCPTEAIVFGDLNDPDSRVTRLKAHPLNYLMLGQLNTRPRTTYLAKLRNPNPGLT